MRERSKQRNEGDSKVEEIHDHFKLPVGAQQDHARRRQSGEQRMKYPPRQPRLPARLRSRQLGCTHHGVPHDTCQAGAVVRVWGRLWTQEIIARSPMSTCTRRYIHNDRAHICWQPRTTKSKHVRFDRVVRAQVRAAIELKLLGRVRTEHFARPKLQQRSKKIRRRKRRRRREPRGGAHEQL